MRITVSAQRGELAASPDEAFEALAKAAQADGADREEWVSKALASAGASSVLVPVRRAPRYQGVDDAVQAIDLVYRRAMVSCEEAIAARLERALRERVKAPGEV